MAQWLLIAIALAGCAGPGRYRAQMTVRSGQCCSQTCETISTRMRVTVDLAPDHTARARWQRTGCRIRESGREAEALRLPGEPESACGVRRVPGGDITRYDGTGELRGRWRRSGRRARVDLGGWQLRCARSEENRLPVLACDFVDSSSTAASDFGPRLLLGEGDGVAVCTLAWRTRVERVQPGAPICSPGW